MLTSDDGMFAVLTPREWQQLRRAGELAFAGSHDEAEATRYAAGYHNLIDDRREQPETPAAA